MSIHVMKAVWDCRLPESVSKNRRSTVKMVLLKLADNSNDNGKCWPSMAKIAHETDMSERSVVRCVSELESCNLIKRITTWVDRKKHNTYFINIPLIESLSEPFERASVSIDDDNPFFSSDSLTVTLDKLSNQNDRLSHKPSMNHHKNHHTKHSSFDERCFVSEISDSDFEYCVEAMRSLESMDSILKDDKSGSNIYTGPMTLDQWSRCEEKLYNACGGKIAAVSELLDNIYLHRKLGSRTSVSLDYMLFGDMELNKFLKMVEVDGWLG